MAYEGVIIGLDLGDTTGVCEGCPGEKPIFDVWELYRGKEIDALLDATTRGAKRLLERIVAPRFIKGVSYGRGEAVDAGLIRIAIEKRIRHNPNGQRNVDSAEVTLGLYAGMGTIARMRGVLVSEVAVSTVRKHFIGIGNLPSEKAKRTVNHMCKALGWNPPNYDASDAGAVWHWHCWNLNHAATPITKPLFSRVLSPG